MLVYLKAIGNAGWIDQHVFKIICDLIYDVATPLHVKVQGIWSLRHMARFRPIWVSLFNKSWRRISECDHFYYAYKL